ncbi:PIN domain-containing protein [Baekduia sp.]|uniref:type II toxin-antitoxin system VapC family toxin n=1 Tax=Baekduia sp. TaxID=2600305 RepID=UPI002E0A9403|nr:PIN domain-containing protein [Baekduia sp.]
MIVLDASVLIAHFDQHDALHSRATEHLLDVADQQLGASSITLAEILVGPTRTDHLSAAQAALRALDVAELPLPPNAATRLAALRVETALKLPDCCVLLAAQDAHGTVLTFDDRLGREAARLGLIL